MSRKDARMMLTTENLTAIKFIKANAFEEHFYDKIDVEREKELGFISKK